MPDLDTAVRLRIEYFSNTEARVLSWTAFAATLCVLGTAVALVVLKFVADERKVLFEEKSWYVANVVLAGTTLLCLLALAAKFAYNLHSTRMARRAWNHRRRGLARIAGAILAIQILCCVFWLTPYALTLGYQCVWFTNTIDWLAFFRWSCYNVFFLWCVMSAHSCCRYRGPDPPAHPDEQLVMDVSPAQKLRLHVPHLLLLWMPFQALIAADVYARLTDSRDQVADDAACKGLSYQCDSEPYAEVFNILEICLVALYLGAYVFYLRRAFQDHAVLPFARYRLSNTYIRLSAQHGVLAFGVVVLSLIILSVVHYESCWAYMDSALGASPIQLAMALMVAVNSVALMPKNVHSREMLTTWQQQFCWTQAALPAAMAARDVEQQRGQGRALWLHQRLLSGGRRLAAQAAQVAHEIAEVPEAVGHSLADLVSGVEVAPPNPASRQQQQQQQEQQQAQEPPTRQPGSTAQAAAHARAATAGQQQQQQAQQPPTQQQPGATAQAAAPQTGAASAGQQQPGATQGLPPGQSLFEQLTSLPSAPAWRQHSKGNEDSKEKGERGEPMFCVELAVRLLHWSKFAYRHWHGVHGGMNQESALGLFGLTGFQALHDPQNDTRLLLGWKEGTVLVAFRGTASKANVMTDLKFLRTPVLPRRHHNGRLAMVHSGFYRAYTANEDNTQLQSLVAELVSSFAPGQPLKLILTGHSLGGALCVLAAWELSQAYPYADITVVTFGSPRVGNRAFAALYRSLVPNTFQVVNDQDPVPRISGTGFNHSGLPVIINSRGDILVRPSYFELLSRTGGVMSHHKVQNYALSFAAIIKAQFSASKQLPGGEVGAAELAGALDLSAALAVRHLDATSLADPQLLPELNDPGIRKKQANKASFRMDSVLSCCSGSPEAAAAVEAAEQEDEEDINACEEGDDVALAVECAAMEQEAPAAGVRGSDGAGGDLPARVGPALTAISVLS